MNMSLLISAVKNQCPLYCPKLEVEVILVMRINHHYF